MKNNKLSVSRSVQILLAVFLFTVSIGLLSNLLPPAVDFHGAFRPAALEILHGRSPYNAEGFLNPPWTAILLIPFAIFPESLGRALMVIVSLSVYAYVAHKLGANKWTIAMLLVSPPVLHGVLNGNIDWLAVAGVIMPPWLGLFFISIKPQVGIAVVVFLFFNEWREGGLKRVLKTFTPFGIVLILSIVIFGPWFLSIPSPSEVIINASLWPLSIPIGLALTVTAIRKREIRYAMIASPMSVPYLLLHSWAGAFIALAPFPFETAAVVIGTWIVFFLRYFS